MRRRAGFLSTHRQNRGDMADFRAIETASKALIHLLETSYAPDDFDVQLQFEVYVAESFKQPITAGVSLFLYRVTANGSHRIPAGRQAPGGGRYDTQLPLDLHYLITIWAQDASVVAAYRGVISGMDHRHRVYQGVRGVVFPNRSVECVADGLSAVARSI